MKHSIPQHPFLERVTGGPWFGGLWTYWKDLGHSFERVSRCSGRNEEEWVLEEQLLVHWSLKKRVSWNQLTVLLAHFHFLKLPAERMTVRSHAMTWTNLEKFFRLHDWSLTTSGKRWIEHTSYVKGTFLHFYHWSWRNVFMTYYICIPRVSLILTWNRWDVKCWLVSCAKHETYYNTLGSPSSQRVGLLCP